MTLYIAELTTSLRLERALSEADEGAVREALLLVRRFLDGHAPYATLLRNYQELEAYLERLDAEFAGEQRALRTAQHIDVMMLEANRLMMNFLASARSYLDITGPHLHSFSDLAQPRYETWRSVQYDQSVSYRFFENLRNQAQHRDLPPVRI